MTRALSLALLLAAPVFAQVNPGSGSTASTVSVSAGTASLPSISFKLDRNTGFYSPGADSLAVTLGGSAVLTLTATTLTHTGSIGLLTSNATANGALRLMPTGTGAGAYNRNVDVYSRGGANNEYLHLGVDQQSWIMAAGSQAGAYLWSGKNGTGIALPIYIGSGVDGNDQISSTLAAIAIASGSRNVTIGAAALVGAGTSSAPSLSFSGDADTGFYSRADGSVGLTLNNTVKAYWTSDGIFHMGASGNSAVFQSELAAATATSTVPAINLLPLNTLDANDLVLKVADAANTKLVGVDNEGDMVVTGAITAGSTLTRGAITLSGGTGTATVVSGATCVCSDATAANAVKCAVSGTTLTATGTGTDGINYVCL